MNKETLHFRIGLSGSSATRHPTFVISLNDVEFVSATLSNEKNQTEYFEFDAEVDEGNCSLTIELKNKTKYDTVLDANGNIIEDLLLNIDSIEIDEIDLGSLLWTASDYRPDYPGVHKAKMQAQGIELPESVKNCVNLGWNGKWILPFTSPFYIWLLENI
jgi:hypothetical protein